MTCPTDPDGHDGNVSSAILAGQSVGVKIIGCSVETVDYEGNKTYTNLNSIKSVRDKGGTLYLIQDSTPWYQAQWSMFHAYCCGTDTSVTTGSATEPPQNPPPIPVFSKPIYQFLEYAVVPGTGFDLEAAHEALARLIGCCDCAATN